MEDKIKTFNEFLIEYEKNPNIINELNVFNRKPLEYVKVDNNQDLTEYLITTEKTKYIVRIIYGIYDNKEVCELSFKEINNINITNHNEIFDLLSTVMAIAKEYVDKRHPAILYFDGEYREKEDRSLPSIRTKIYYEYVKQHTNDFFPNATYELKHNRILIYF